jgi:TolB-like protein
LGDLVAELKRRRVFRAIAVYAVAAFAVLQVVEPVMHGLHLPEWVLTLVIVLLAAGFPLAALLSWSFDLGPGGVTRTPDEDPGRRGTTVAPRSGALAVLVIVSVAVGALLAVVSLRVMDRQPPPSPSVAVLPFADMSPGKDQEYFADGMAEEILNALAHVRGLRVIGRTSSFSFKGTKEDLKTIARKLGVGTLLEGSVRRDSGRIRVTAKLIAAIDGAHLWSATYDREASSVFQVQDEIARATVVALLPKLLGRPEAEPATLPATSPEAYNRYLVGKQHLARSSGDSARRAIRAFEQALEIDEAYAPAWAGLADALSFIATFSEDEDPIPYLDRGLAAADRAVALAPSGASGYTARILLRLQRWNWDGARSDAERAIQIDPGSASPYRRYAQVHRVLGDQAAELTQLEHGTILEPLSAPSWSQLGRGLRIRGRLDEARGAFHRALEIDPQHQWTISEMAYLELLSGRLEEARSWYARCEGGSARTHLTTG